MTYDLDDTIAAVGSAAGGSARGIVRLSGQDTAACLLRCLKGRAALEAFFASTGRPRRSAATIQLPRPGDEIAPLSVPVDVLYWPTRQSYTRQPSAELHTLGSPPIVAAIVDELCRRGARPALPGEFTLRAFLAGRIDLTQAEGVLGVVDARSGAELQSALEQIAGGLSRPLAALRGDLLELLAELEAGLDFAEEQVEFVSREELTRRLAHASACLEGVARQFAERRPGEELPRVVLTGAPNVGKSSLFNALVRSCGQGRDAAIAIVSPTPGATRDYVTARIVAGGVECELADTAGADMGTTEAVAQAAQEATRAASDRAEVHVVCRETTLAALNAERLAASALLVLTKGDLASADQLATAASAHPAAIVCSAATGAAVQRLAAAIGERLRDSVSETSGAAFSAATIARCGVSVKEAGRALSAASTLVAVGREELLAAELRAALVAVGDMVGATTTDDVLDRIFSKFCIGK